jgi:hypothetical protein
MRNTAHGHKCAQHLRAEDGLLIARSTLAGCGLGLFSTVTRKKGDCIAPYTGIHVQLRRADETYGGAYVLQLTQTQFIDAADPASGAARYSNTARALNIARRQCRGNNAHFEMMTVTPYVTYAQWKGKSARTSASAVAAAAADSERRTITVTPKAHRVACIVASRVIKAGEEVLTVYGNSYNSFPPLPRVKSVRR